MFGFEDNCGHDPHPLNIDDLFDSEDTICEFFRPRPDDWGLIMSKGEWAQKYKPYAQRLKEQE